MRMSLDGYRELESYNKDFSQLIDKYEQRDFDFVNDVKKWLKKIEDLLHRMNLLETSSFANYRLQIVSSERVSLRNTNMSYSKKRKIVDESILRSLIQAQNTIYQLLSKTSEEYYTCKQIMRNLILTGITSKILNENLREFDRLSIKAVWRDFISHPKTSSQTLRILEIINYSEAIDMLLESLTEFVGEQKKFFENSNNTK